MDDLLLALIDSECMTYGDL